MAYTATVTTDQRHPERIGRQLSILTGRVDVTEYNSTLVAITDISGHFRRLDAVLVDGPTDNGYQLAWVSASNAFKAWMSDLSSSVDGPLVELTDAVDAGAVDFVAIGMCNY